MNAYTFADLFSGCGGFSAGFASHRQFRGTMAVDSWEAALQTYQANIPGVEVCVADLADSAVARRLPGNLDVLLGGPPCQGFSTLGKRRDDDKRSTLVDEFASICLKLQPKMIIMENVRGILTKKHPNGDSFAAQFTRRLQSGRKVRYVCAPRLVNALDYGLAQSRVRWVMVAVREDLMAAASLTDVFWREFESHRVRTHSTLRDVIGDLPVVEPGEGVDVRLVRRARKAHPIYNHKAMNHSPELVRRFSYVPPGGGLPDVPRRYLTPHLRKMVDGGYGSGGHVKNIYGRLEWEKPSGTIVAGMDKITCGRFVHPEQDRLLTPRECARLQSFPDNFRFFGGMVTQYYMIGNAVPPRLSELFAMSASKALSSAKRESVRRSARRSA